MAFGPTSALWGWLTHAGSQISLLYQPIEGDVDGATGHMAPRGVASTRVETAVRPPRLEYQLHTLDNGLTVILSEDHSTPIVHLQLVYRVGSKNERPGRTGFAHLFEHMMFKGSRNVLPDSHLTLISRVGGDGNAYTTEDETVFVETVPAQYLPLVLWLEADRMATLRIDEKTFEAERQVVKEERRCR